MPENNYHRLVVFILFICPQPLRRLLYNLASATVTSGQHFDFDRFLRFEKTTLDNLVKRNEISKSQYHRIYHIAGESNINDLDVLSLVKLLQCLFKNEITKDQSDALECIQKKYFLLLMLSVNTFVPVTSKYFETMWTQLEEATLTLANKAGVDFKREISELIEQAKCNSLPNALTYVDAWYIEASNQHTDNEEDQCHECNFEEQATSAVKEHNETYQDILEEDRTIAVDEQKDLFQRVSDRSFHKTETTTYQINQKTLVDKNEVIHYKVSLSCWPNLKHSHELIETLTGYCHDLEQTLKLSGTDEQHMEHIENVDVFVRGMSFDITDLSAEPEKHVRQDTKIYFISENMTRGMITKFAGILIETDRIRLVDSVSDTTLHVKDDVTLKNKCQNRMLDINSVIEMALFEPLFGKIKLLSRLISASSCDIEEECSDMVNQDPSNTEILYDRLTPSYSLTSVGERQTVQTDGTMNEFNEDTMRNIRQHKHQIDRLLGEMIALTNRSTLSENVRPAVVHGYKTRELSKQIAEDLFQLHPTIKCCGYRYSTLHINVEHVSNASEHERRNTKIKTFLSGKNIEDYRLIYIEGPIKDYKYVGAQILSGFRKEATLGCFSRYTKENQESVCGLLSKHFVLHSSKIYVGNDVHFGTVLPATNEAGGYDIAAAEIVKRHVPQLDTRFKNYEDEVRPAYLYDKTDNNMLLNQPVYLRGAKTTLGVGTIHIPQVQRSGDTGMAYIQMIDGSYALGKPSGKLAVEGDSGAIICMDKLGTRNVHVLSMLMGEVLCQPKETAKKYSSLRLSCGLTYLEYKTKGKFTLKGIESGQEIVEQIPLELLESLPIGTNETGQENSTDSIENTDMEETDLSD